MPKPDWTMVLLFVLPSIVGMTGMYHYAQLLVEMGSNELFALSTVVIISSSTSQVARIIELSHSSSFSF
jgi:hypothetical protein